MEQQPTIGEILHHIRDQESTVRRGLEEIDRLSVILHNTALERAKELEDLKKANLTEEKNHV